MGAGQSICCTAGAQLVERSYTRKAVAEAREITGGLILHTEC